MSNVIGTQHLGENIQFVELEHCSQANHRLLKTNLLRARGREWVLTFNCHGRCKDDHQDQSGRKIVHAEICSSEEEDFLCEIYWKKKCFLQFVLVCLHLLLLYWMVSEQDGTMQWDVK